MPTYTNSPLVAYKKISPNKTSPRNHAIDTITIHCMAGNMSVESCGSMFALPGRKASSNYGIGSDGRIALYVEEKDRSWCSSSASNDHRAVTIEVANDGGANTGWHVSDEALSALIELVTDICRRNNIKELKWRADKSLIGQVDKQNMTVHRWFANKSCPGDYLYHMHGTIADDVNKKLNEEKENEANAKKENPYMEPERTLYKKLLQMHGDDVKWAQWHLIRKGFLPEKKSNGKTNIDGYFGKDTDAAVREFQKFSKISVDGRVGVATRKYLKA